ncbi:MAG TPA: Ig-like domain-containing protein, partial [Clostridia bacterium]|nr:Ig-like domain-containing protein [Clostridia bacterium]
MKKVLIGMLLIIPVLVILIVSATASIVQGAHIAVESVVLYMPDESGHGIVEVEDTILAYISDVGIQLEAIVYPTRATNKTINWTVENETIKLGASVLSVDNNGNVSYHGLGSADVVATAEGNIKARCRILVTSADVMGIAISDNIPMNFGVGDRHQMEAA